MSDSNKTPQAETNEIDYDLRGQVFARAVSSKGDGSFYPVALAFVGKAELISAMKFIAAQKWQPFTDVINLKVDGTPQTDDPQEQGPGCPYHGDKYLEPSKRRKGWLFCKKKLLDGTYCKHEEPA